ncbi:MAG: ImmA/IrrE family metallo-endopeptidase [Muribaculaceae bacterium]|nr:ImmA/IrrE family metallo-endopeptidase [Muribaculaceae bacterium]
MKLENPYNLPIVDAFIRLYGELIADKCAWKDRTVRFLPLPDYDNKFRDIIVRYRDAIYISSSEIGQLGLTRPEIFASLAHELGHIVYGMQPFGIDAETRADGFAAELGLASQMISVIEKIIQSRRFRGITSQLVQRIQFLQHLEKPEVFQECYYG